MEDPVTKSYVVLGEEGASVDVVGTVFAVGDTVTLREDVAAPLVAEGKLGEEEIVPPGTDVTPPANESSDSPVPTGEPTVPAGGDTTPPSTPV